jgi:membrane associated rhomboid family serine protease
MGIYDRDYYREETQGVFLSGPWSAVGTIIAINGLFFLIAEFFAGGELASFLALRADLVERTLQGEVWRPLGLLTYGFAHADMLHIFLNMFTLWMFGREVEGIYGKRLFWQLYLTLLVMAGVCSVLAQNFVFHRPHVSEVGASGAVVGMVVIFVLHYPRRMILLMGVIPMPAWLLGVIYVGADVIGAQREAITGYNEHGIGYAAHLGGALFGAIFYRFHWTLLSLLPTRWLRKLPRRRKRSELRVVYEPDDDELDAQVDRILAKISRYGTDSLTEEEHRTLEAASKRAQRKRGVRSD